MTDKKKRAIIIDDDEVNLMIIGAVLETMNYPYDKFTSSKEAWKQIQKHQYSLFIIDWRMPEYDGLTLVKKIRKLYNEFAVILMLSASDSGSEIDEAISQGVDDYQIKPISTDHLMRRIKILDARSHMLEERRTMQDRLRESRAHFKAIFDNSAVGVMVMDLAGGIIEYNSTLCKMVGFLEITQSEKFQPDIIHPDEKDSFSRFLRFFTAEIKTKTHYRCRLITRSGAPLWGKFGISKVLDDQGQGFLIIIIEDITDEKLFEQQLNYDALHDSLTGLPNRELFRDRVNNTLLRQTKQAEKNPVMFSVLIVNVDRFQIINESLGHNNGDELIRQLSVRLKNIIHAEDTLARLTGDEFGIINETAHSVAEVSYYIKTLQMAFIEPFRIESHDLNITGSIGVKCFTPDENFERADLLRDADTALHRAKDYGANRFEFFIAEMNRESRETLQLENDLRKAIENEELELYFQPQVDLNIGRICGVEALIRWNHPKRGLLSPSKFIPIAEKAGLIIEIGEWVLEKSIEKMAHWSGLGYKPLSMAINFSAPQFHQQGLLSNIREIQKRFPDNENRLKIEITESILMEKPEAAVSTLKDLKKRGILLALDDFGTGYSSLTYLKTLPIDFIKIDQSFIRNIVSNESDRSIVMAIIAMSHSLKKKAIAEGVENKDQMNMLASMYCDMVQGFYINQPMREQELFRYFDSQLNKDVKYEP